MVDVIDGTVCLVRPQKKKKAEKKKRRRVEI